jgi:cytochrome c peroxidase
VALVGLSGFDSPIQAASLQESAEALRSLKKHLNFWSDHFNQNQIRKEWEDALQISIEKLEEGDFEQFDRYHFIKNHIHPLLGIWNKMGKDWNVDFPFELALKNDATSLFSANTFNMAYFTDPKMMDYEIEKAALGKRLFNDKNLSINNTMSCASCHKRDLAFTDGLQTSLGQNRNSPTLAYAGLQRKFFHDGRAGSLEGQIVSVVKSESEFHSNLDNLVQKVQADSSYALAFKKLYSRGISDMSIGHAIGSYIRSLAPFNSRFDNNINGISDDLSKEEILGFNLFMGKAACATCHFPPVFNGTVPPEFAESELEIIGVPSKADTTNASIDPDLGAWSLFHTPQRKYFFKTPTIRNIAKTAPYMHNGVYTSLEEVMDFYNRGGGAGIGIELESQTLPPDPLHLTKAEQKAIIRFMETLSDKLKQAELQANRNRSRERATVYKH